MKDTFDVNVLNVTFGADTFRFRVVTNSAPLSPLYLVPSRASPTAEMCARHRASSIARGAFAGARRVFGTPNEPSHYIGVCVVIDGEQVAAAAAAAGAAAAAVAVFAIACSSS